MDIIAEGAKTLSRQGRARRALERRFGKALDVAFRWQQMDTVRVVDLETDSFVVCSFKGKRMQVIGEHDGAR